MPLLHEEGLWITNINVPVTTRSFPRSGTGWRILVHFHNKSSGIPALFAPVELPHAAADNPEYLPAPADRTPDHGQQVYVAYNGNIGWMKKVVLSLGGSILFPTLEENRVSAYAGVLGRISRRMRLFVVVGGGGEARRYISAAREIGLDEALADEIGILVTRLNATLLAGALGDAAFPAVTENQTDAYAAAGTGKIVVMGGITPAQTTDAVAAVLAERVGADLMVNLTSVDGIYTADPKTDPAARRLELLSVDRLLEIVVAAKVLKRSGIPLLVIDGRNPEHLEEVLLAGRYSGSLVTGTGEKPAGLL
jgi:uridylate kinase